MSRVSLKTIKLGDSADTSKNFLISVPTVPDGTLTIERENGTDVLSMTTLGKLLAGQMGVSKTGNGYIELPNGIILQWVTSASTALSAGVPLAVGTTLPLAFPTACLSVFACYATIGNAGIAPLYNISGTTTTVYATAYSASIGQNVIVTYFAVGY